MTDMTVSRPSSKAASPTTIRWRVTRMDTGTSWEGADGYGAATEVPRVVRMAARPLGLKVPGRSEQVPEHISTDDWVARWSGVELQVHRIRPSSGQPGASVSHSDRRESGDSRVEVYLAPDAKESLDLGVSLHRTRRAAIEVALRNTYPVARKK